MRKLHLDTNLDDVTFLQFLEAYIVSMRNDMSSCLTDDQIQFLEKVHLRFLPTGLANAQCVNADVAGHRQPFFIAFINEGLYFALNQLFTALIFEELQGDLSAYQRDGNAAFEAAITLFLEPFSENIEAVPLDLGDDSAIGEVQAHLSSVTTIVLLFVSLHEFAHAWLGHHHVCDAAHLAMVTGKVPEQLASKVWDCEFEADDFAFRALMSRTRTVESQWAHGFVLYLFFAYLGEVERRIGKPLSPDHPPPKQRAAAVIKILRTTFPDAIHLESDILRLDALIKKWTAPIMTKTFQISLLSDNSKLLEDAIASGDLETPEGCDIAVDGKNRGMGFGSASEILILAVGIAGGIPAGVIANAIYDKIKGSNPEKPIGFTVTIGEEVAKDLDSFEVILKRKIEETT
ncbi:MAG: hypothetical protein ABJR46_16525 [Tateyamaria sp.]|uniref:hypothetical protein n=1 Tax=Tateyamaria sp. TaxID=1929288 RepID=UPI00329C40B9